VDGVADLLARARCTAQVVQAGDGVLEEPTVVVRIDRGAGDLPELNARPTASKKKKRARRPR
jgi:hypothetical protein